VCVDKNNWEKYTVSNIPAGGINPQNIDKVKVVIFNTNNQITDRSKKEKILRGCNRYHF
jgi:hypothetical protein